MAPQKRFCVKGHDTHLCGRRRHSYVCNECARVRSKAWAIKSKLRMKESRWRRSGINLTPLEFDELRQWQRGRCWICKRTELEFGKELVPDHNHKTGFVRGLLCPNCNAGIGMLGDSQQNLAAAVRYLDLARGR